MAKRGKKYTAMMEQFKVGEYPLSEAVEKAKKHSYSSFPGTISVHFAMTLPKDKETKSIKGTVSLPHPISTADTRVIVFCKEDRAEEAKKAGAIEAGLEELVKKVQEGWSDFDVALATPDVMGEIAVLGKELGPKGLMPNPKTGTLVEDPAKAVEEFRKGKTKFICDEGGVVHVAVGKIDTDTGAVEENVRYTLQTIADTIGKPVQSLAKSITLSPTMGPGVTVAIESVSAKSEE
jgi:large subunit ribosomal protein L1